MAFDNRSGSDRRVMADINVTPMVDVMLVLLVIFMVTAPMMQQGVQVNLPKAEAKALNAPEEAVVVSIETSGRIFIDKTDKCNYRTYLPSRSDFITVATNVRDGVRFQVRFETLRYEYEPLVAYHAF